MKHPLLPNTELFILQVASLNWLYLSLSIALSFLLFAVITSNMNKPRIPKGKKLPPGPRGFPLVGHLPYGPRNFDYKRCLEISKQHGPVFRLVQFSISTERAHPCDHWLKLSFTLRKTSFISYGLNCNENYDNFLNNYVSFLGLGNQEKLLQTLCLMNNCDSVISFRRYFAVCHYS